jgi:hypothetical protein
MFNDPMLDRKKILEAFDALAADLQGNGVAGELFVVGGGAMALAYNTDRVTRDIDAVFEPKDVVYDAAGRVAESLGLERYWLNDAAKIFVHGEDPQATVHYERPGLTVRVASPRYLFTMKALAAREVDYDDLRTLYGLSGFKSAGEALDAVEQAYPQAQFMPIVQYVVEGIAREHDMQRPDDRSLGWDR